MKRRRRLKKGSNFRGMCGISAFVLVLLAVLAVGSHTLKQKNADYITQIAQIQQDISLEEERTEEITELKDYMQTDEYAEQVARDKLGLVYGDETVFVPKDN